MDSVLFEVSLQCDNTTFDAMAHSKQSECKCHTQHTHAFRNADPLKHTKSYTTSKKNGAVSAPCGSAKTEKRMFILFNKNTETEQGLSTATSDMNNYTNCNYLQLLSPRKLKRALF